MIKNFYHVFLIFIDDYAIFKFKSFYSIIGLVAIMIVSIILNCISKRPTLINILHVPYFIIGLIISFYVMCFISFVYPKLKWTISGQRINHLIPLIFLVALIAYDYLMTFSIKIPGYTLIQFFNFFILTFNFCGIWCGIEASLKLKQHNESHGRIPIYKSIVLFIIAAFLIMLSTVLQFEA